MLCKNVECFKDYLFRVAGKKVSKNICISVEEELPISEVASIVYMYVKARRICKGVSKVSVPNVVFISPNVAKPILALRFMEFDGLPCECDICGADSNELWEVYYGNKVIVWVRNPDNLGRSLTYNDSGIICSGFNNFEYLDGNFRKHDYAIEQSYVHKGPAPDIESIWKRLCEKDLDYEYYDGYHFRERELKYLLWVASFPVRFGDHKRGIPYSGIYNDVTKCFLRPLLIYHIGDKRLVIDYVENNSNREEFNSRVKTYENEKVEEFWIFNPSKRSVDVFNLGKDGKYIQSRGHCSAELVSKIDPRVSFNFGALMK